MSEKRKELEKNQDFVVEILKKGGEKIRNKAEERMKEIREKIGIVTTY